MATPGSPGSSSEDMDYDYFDDDNAEDLSYSDLEVFPGGSQISTVCGKWNSRDITVNVEIG